MKPSPPPAWSPDPRAGPWGCGSRRSAAQTGRDFSRQRPAGCPPSSPTSPSCRPHAPGPGAARDFPTHTGHRLSRFPAPPGCECRVPAAVSKAPFPSQHSGPRSGTLQEGGSPLSPLRQDGPSCWASPCLERTPFTGLGPTAHLTLPRCQLRAPRLRGRGSRVHLRSHSPTHLQARDHHSRPVSRREDLSLRTLLWMPPAPLGCPGTVHP